MWVCAWMSVSFLYLNGWPIISVISPVLCIPAVTTGCWCCFLWSVACWGFAGANAAGLCFWGWRDMAATTCWWGWCSLPVFLPSPRVPTFIGCTSSCSIGLHWLCGVLCWRSRATGAVNRWWNERLHSWPHWCTRCVHRVHSLLATIFILQTHSTVTPLVRMYIKYIQGMPPTNYWKWHNIQHLYQHSSLARLLWQR